MLHQEKLLIPILGIGLFLLLYLLAAVLYPGGSNADSLSEGFSLRYNYWCDLMASTAKNGAKNPGRPVALSAWAILCISLSAFWVFLPSLFKRKAPQHKIIQYLGSLTMGVALFSFTKHHDTIISLASVLGTITLTFVLLELKKAKQYDLIVLGGGCFLLGLVNYFIYTTHYQIWLLPIIQKVTYAFCLLTFALISHRIYRKGKTRYKHSTS